MLHRLKMYFPVVNDFKSEQSVIAVNSLRLKHILRDVENEKIEVHVLLVYSTDASTE